MGADKASMTKREKIVFRKRSCKKTTTNKGIPEERSVELCVTEEQCSFSPLGRRIPTLGKRVAGIKKTACVAIESNRTK